MAVHDPALPEPEIPPPGRLRRAVKWLLLVPLGALLLVFSVGMGPYTIAFLAALSAVSITVAAYALADDRARKQRGQDYREYGG